MSATQPILTAIEQHLKAKLPQWEIQLFPNDPSSYYLAHSNGAVLISYAGSKFGKQRASDIVSQSRSVNIVLTVLTRDLHDDMGALNLLDELRLLLVGFQPPNCTECWLVDEFFDGNNEQTGIWQYQLVLQTETVQLQQVPPQDLPKLVEVIHRRQGQSLNLRLTPKQKED